MATHKLLFDYEEKEKYSLLAIHCSEEAYKVAYLLNKHLGLQLKREVLDLDYSRENIDITYPLFKFDDSFEYTTFYLVANKCKSIVAVEAVTTSLFSEDTSEKTVTNYLLPEFKKVDFFLKIHSEYEVYPLQDIIGEINKIKQIISAYHLEAESIKSKNNLIFD